MFQRAHRVKLTLIILTFLISSVSCATRAEVAQASGAKSTASVVSPQLAELRLELARHYLEPAPHMALAKYYLEQGDRLQAFYLLEYARRARFPETEFNQAFQNSFGVNVDASEERAGATLFDKGTALQKEGKLAQAEAAFVKAAELAPHSVDIQAWTGRFFYKVRQDNERALRYYLNAYFLSPHAYETEFVESRIRKINWEVAAVRYRQLKQSGVPVEKIVSDANSNVILQALEEMSASWNPSYLKLALELMAHDDEGIRWQAADAIMKHADRSFDPTLQALLKDNDLRKRGLAAYIAVHLWKEESFDTLRAMLGEDAELLRFDALSALAMEGGNQSRQIILQHRRRETNPTLKSMIDSMQKSLTNP